MKTHVRSARQLGFSLVELMVALSIGVFLLAGALTVFGKTRDLYRTNDAAARLQETARYAMGTLESDLRMANYWGLMSRSDFVQNGPTLDPANPPNVNTTYTLPAGLTGFAATISQCGGMWGVKLPAYVEATDSYTYGCAAFGAGAVANADTLTIRRVSATPLTAAQLLTSNGRIKIQTSRVQGSLFANTTIPAGYAPPLSESRVLIVNGYYIDQDSDERAGTPSLRRKQLDRNTAGNAPAILDRQIVPGVEDLQVELGADFNEDQNADYFVAPNVAIPAGDQIVAVRVWLMVRAEQADLGYTDNNTYSYASRTGANVFVPADSFHRVLVSKTIALRNTRR